MATMPRPRPPHLQHEMTRHGALVWYVRVGKSPRTRIRAEYGTPEFDEQYRAAVTGARVTKAAAPSESLQWLIETYRKTSAHWLNILAPATRRQRENIFKHVVALSGARPYKAVTRGDIEAGRDRRVHTPAQARNFLDAMRGLFRWALEVGHRKDDPTLGVKNPPKRKGPGFIPWTEEHVEKYQARWPIGTKERVWLDVLLYSGLRRGDAVRYGRQHVRSGVGRLKTEKSGFMVAAIVPVLPVLQRTLDAGPTGDLTFVVGERGQPLTKESFGNMFREACRLADVPGSAHGVRKIAATTAANNGATTAQLKALFAWTDDAMPSLYTKAADAERLAREAGHMLGNDERTSIPAPGESVRAVSRKPK